jgi:MarR family transcriptional regulator, transcriptional regulator for hemolysin
MCSSEAAKPQTGLAPYAWQPDWHPNDNARYDHLASGITFHKGRRLDDFHRDLLFLLHDVARLLRVEADKRARQHGMTRAQWAILIWLERQPGISQKELSELLEVEPITVARLIDRLETRGMVERRPDPRDRRIWRLHLLTPAREVLHEIDDHRADMTRIVTDGIDEMSLETMTEALLRMKSTLTHDSHAKRGIEADAPEEV